MNLGHPAAEAFQLMRDGERERERGGIGMKAQFDHNWLATFVTATERERERKLPITASKAAAVASRLSCSIFLEPLLNVLHTFL